MESAELRLRDKDAVAVLLPALGFCLFDGLAPFWLCRSESPSILALTFGAFAAQLLWCAAWCALGPGRWIRRFVAAIALGTVAGGAALGGIYLAFDAAPPLDPTYVRVGQSVRVVKASPRQQARDFVLRCGSVLPQALWVAQLPWFCTRALRGWRIAFCPAESRVERHDLRKFGVADVLAFTTAVALVFGFWRVNLLFGDEPVHLYLAYWVGNLGYCIVACAVLSLIGGTLAIPIAPFALGDTPPRFGFTYTCTYLLVIVMALGLVRQLTDARQEFLNVLYVVVAFLAAAAFSVHLSFWVARDVGYRLVRAPRPRPTLHNEAAGAD